MARRAYEFVAGAVFNCGPETSMRTTMSGWDYIFGASGRFNRANFWIVSLLVVLVFPFAFVAGTFAWSWLRKSNVPHGFDLLTVSMLSVLFVSLVIGFGAFFAQVAASVKRMHDRDKSGAWVLLFWGMPFVLDQAAHLAVAPVSTGLAIAAVAITLWGLIEMGVVVGTPGSNFFGPDPRDEGSWSDAGARMRTV